ncbi:MAG: ribosome biogenesis GTPase Der [Candidatus Omnitrophica bacterium]|nr:ribosome biogenesis GTPase Der [Candidatus Omnitrophota bacterium]
MEKQLKQNITTVAIIGRPNVGKSFLFNRFAGKAVSLVDAEPGVTRDRLYAEVRCGDKIFYLVDTGGFYPGGGEGMDSMIKNQVEFSIKEAGVIVWVLDAKDGVTPVDEDIALKLRPVKKPIILAVNKADNISRMEDTGDFYRLGFGEPISISALHGLNTDVLLDKIITYVPESEIKAGEESIWISVVGRPNVGKSSFINSLLNDNRVIVDKEPGTTRGVIPIPFSFEERQFTLLDTSGLRKKNKVYTDLEQKMSVWTRRVIRRSHVSILLLDAQDGVTSQDARISDYIWENSGNMVIAFNKCDLLKGDDKVRRKYIDFLHKRIRVSNFCPVLFISALFGQDVFTTISTAKDVFNHSRMRVKTNVLNKVIEETVKKHQAAYAKGKHLKILYATQASVEPPSFVFFVNDASLVKENYKRYLTKVIYSHFDFSGTPIQIFFRTRKRRKFYADGYSP